MNMTEAQIQECLQKHIERETDGHIGLSPFTVSFMTSGNLPRSRRKVRRKNRRSFDGPLYTVAMLTMLGHTVCGVSKRNPTDEFNPLRGEYLALQRAADEWLKVAPVRHTMG